MDCPAQSVQDSRKKNKSRLAMNWNTSGSNPVEVNDKRQEEESACAHPTACSEPLIWAWPLDLSSGVLYDKHHGIPPHAGDVLRLLLRAAPDVWVSL